MECVYSNFQISLYVKGTTLHQLVVIHQRASSMVCSFQNSQKKAFCVKMALKRVLLSSITFKYLNIFIPAAKQTTLSIATSFSAHRYFCLISSSLNICFFL